jgi:hypothetical protein
VVRPYQRSTARPAAHQFGSQALHLLLVGGAVTVAGGWAVVTQEGPEPGHVQGELVDHQIGAVAAEAVSGAARERELGPRGELPVAVGVAEDELAGLDHRAAGIVAGEIGFLTAAPDHGLGHPVGEAEVLDAELADGQPAGEGLGYQAHDHVEGSTGVQVRRLLGLDLLHGRLVRGEEEQQDVDPAGGCGVDAAADPPHSQWLGALASTSPRIRRRCSDAMPSWNGGEKVPNSRCERPRATHPSEVTATLTQRRTSGPSLVVTRSARSPIHWRAASGSLISRSR